MKTEYILIIIVLAVIVSAYFIIVVFDKNKDIDDDIIYLAGNAPRVPDWFVVEMPELEKTPPHLIDVFGERSNHEHKDFFIRYWVHDYDFWGIPDDITPPEGLLKDVQALVDDWNCWYKIKNEHQIESVRQRVIQWPYYYASNVLNHISEKTS